MEEEIAEEEGRNPAKEKREKPEKTPEDLAAIAYLDRLRSGEGETMPMNLPLACVVKVVAYEEVPKANDRYALATLLGPAGRTWKMCINRYYMEEGMRALFVSGDAAMPNTDRFRNRDVAKVKLRVFRFGFGVKEARLLPIVSRNIYYYNCGLLYPLDEFPELKGVRTGTVCATKLGIEKVYDLRRLAAMPKTKKGSVFVPGGQ